MMPDSLNMPKGSVRAIVTFSLIFLLGFTIIWSVVHIKWDELAASMVIPVLLPIMEKLVMLALVFYFMKGKAKEGGE